MKESGWHVPDEVLQRYAGGADDWALGEAVETHLTRCPQCRVAVVRLADPSQLEHLWDRVHTTISAPPDGLLVRAGLRLGIHEADVVVVRASSGLHRPWVVAVLGAVVAAVVSAMLDFDLRDLTFLVIAPLVPALAVAVAYDTTDPVRELTASTPASKLRVALLRAATTLAVALPVTSAVGLLVPGLDQLAFVWLLPSLALTAMVLVLLTWLTAWTASAATGAAWVLTAVVLARNGGAAGASLDIASGAAQVACAVLATQFTLLLILRTSSTRLLGGYT